MSIPERPEWDDRPDNHFSVLLPFIAVESVGGRYDDHGFAAGFQMGIIDGQLSGRRVAATTYLIFRDLVEQVDLIAMKHGYKTDVLNQDDEWVQIGVTRHDDWPQVETIRADNQLNETTDDAPEICPKNHDIIVDPPSLSSNQTVALTCDGEIFYQKMVVMGQNIQAFVEKAMSDHVIDYLRNRIKELESELTRKDN